MKFRDYDNTIATKRFSLVAKNGVVATSNALASQAGLDILKKGGNAVDAAIATAACLTVVEPTANGIGGDNFALVWMKNKLYGMNSNGYSPSSIDANEIKQFSDTMPIYGWTPVTVPGAPMGWARLNQRFGNLTLLECLQPAINYARYGYPVSINTSKMWKRATKKLTEVFGDDPVFEEWKNTFLIDGRAPEPGELMVLKNHADTLESIGKTDAKSFYEGEIAKKIHEDSQKHKGYLSLSDLQEYDVDWVEPLITRYREVDVVELPPSGQGIVASMALNMLNNFSVSKKDANYYHTFMEAIKLSFADAFAHVTDPKHMKIDAKKLITPEFGKKQFSRIQSEAQDYGATEMSAGGTVYLCTADKEGNMVSFIQSNYMGFGSGVVVKDTGISLQNRGADFSLDDKHINYLAPKKRTYHTIIPAMLMKESKVFAVLGVMGGYMQPQGHVQVISNLIDFSMTPQMALDDVRFQWMKSGEMMLESQFDSEIVRSLLEKKHKIKLEEDLTSFGRGQIIIKDDCGTYFVGTESRTDGNISLY